MQYTSAIFEHTRRSVRRLVDAMCILVCYQTCAIVLQRPRALGSVHADQDTKWHQREHQHQQYNQQLML
jgi:hypothetical protein